MSKQERVGIMQASITVIVGLVAIALSVNLKTNITDATAAVLTPQTTNISAAVDPTATVASTRVITPTHTTAAPTPQLTNTPTAVDPTPTVVSTSVITPTHTTEVPTPQLTNTPTAVDPTATVVSTRVITPTHTTAAPTPQLTNTPTAVDPTATVVSTRVITPTNNTVGTPVQQTITISQDGRVKIDDYWVLKDAVSVEQYQRCVDAGVCKNTSADRSNDSLDRNATMTNITWQQAQAYAGYVGGRLPTAAEWQSACQAGIYGEFTNARSIWEWTADKNELDSILIFSARSCTSSLFRKPNESAPRLGFRLVFAGP